MGVLGVDATTLDTGYIDAVLILLQKKVSTTALAPFGLYETEHGNSLLRPMIISVKVWLIPLNLDKLAHNRITTQTQKITKISQIGGFVQFDEGEWKGVWCVNCLGLSPGVR